MPEFRVRELVNFMRVFGPVRGGQLWCSLKLQLSRGDELRLDVPEIEAPLYLRRQDLPIFDQIMVDQEDDFRAYAQAAGVDATYKKLLAEGRTPVILDCGGHVGFSAVWFARQYPEARVYSLEPHAGNFGLLQQNVAAYPNVVPLRGGVWGRRCQLRITNPGAVSAAFRVEEVPDAGEAGGPELVRGYTVDEVLGMDESNRLLLVKIDIEGAEAAMFEGDTEWLQHAAAVVIELHDWMLPGEATSRSFLKRVGEYDFELIPRGEKLMLFRGEGSGTALVAS